MDNKPYIDMNELAQILCLSYKTVKTYHSQTPEKLPPACKKIGRPLWKRTEVMNWVENSKSAV